MNILCLCPTYGRPLHLIRNSLACFVTQSYPNKHLLLFDDKGNLESFHNLNLQYSVISTRNRVNSLSNKYNVMMKAMLNRYDVQSQGLESVNGYDLDNLPDMYLSDIYGINFRWDAIAIWDDDDLYLPHYLRNHVYNLKRQYNFAGDLCWSKPNKVWTTYGWNCFNEEEQNKPKVTLVDAEGRFHGSVAMTTNMFEEIHGYPDTKEIIYDQQVIGELSKYRPEVATAAGYWAYKYGYVYRWHDSCATHLSTVKKDSDYDSYPGIKTHFEKPLLTPNFDAFAYMVGDELGYKLSIEQIYAYKRILMGRNEQD
jgi:hypothetical protein